MLGLLLLLLSRFSRVRLCVTPWTAAYQAPPSMGFSRQEYWSGLLLPSPMLGLLIDKLINKYFCNWKEYENTVQITVKYTLENLRTHVTPW